MKTQTERLQAIFTDCPGEWISMVDLGAAIGAWAVHSRVADLRRRGMVIQNRKRMVQGKVHSLYRYLPDALGAGPASQAGDSGLAFVPNGGRTSPPPAPTLTPWIYAMERLMKEATCQSKP